MVALVTSGALTVALKTQDGATDPTSLNPSIIAFRDTSTTSGAYITRTATSGASFSLPYGAATMGGAAGTPFALWGVLFDDGGTLRPGLINCRSATDIFPLNEDGLYSSTGGTGGNSAGVFYTGTAVSSKPFRIVTRFEWPNGLTVAGVWETPKAQPFMLGMSRPGQFVRSYTKTGAEGSGGNTASASLVDTNVTGSILLTSPANSVSWEFTMETTVIHTGTAIYGNMTRGGVAVGPLWIGAYGAAPSNAAMVQMVHQEGADFPGSVGPHTYTVRARYGGVASTVYWNDGNGGWSFRLAEVMC